MRAKPPHYIGLPGGNMSPKNNRPCSLKVIFKITMFPIPITFVLLPSSHKTFSNVPWKEKTNEHDPLFPNPHPLSAAPGERNLKKVLCFKVKNFTNNEFWHTFDQNRWKIM